MVPLGGGRPMATDTRPAGGAAAPLTAPADAGVSTENLDLVRAIPVELSVRLGCTTLAINDILQLKPGSIVQLEASVGRSVDLLANGLLIGQGELVLVNDNYGVRLTRLLSRATA